MTDSWTRLTSRKEGYPQGKLNSRGHQRGARGHQVARKDQVGRPRTCSKNNINMINVFTLTNINTKIGEVD